MASPIRTIDLFAGAGGLTAGFHLASNRFEPVVAVEFDRAAAATYAANHPDTTVVNRPIQEWVSEASFSEADVIIGGPPCQGFSALGKQNVNDERNFLWEQYAEVILAVQPKYFVVENVIQFLESPQFKEFESRAEPGGSLSDYDLSAVDVLNAVHYGAPQVRKRTVLIGRHKDMPSVKLPRVTHEDKDSWITVRQAWEGLSQRVTDTQLPDSRTPALTGSGLIQGAFKTSELHLTRHHDPTSIARFTHIPRGGNRFNIPSALLAPCWRTHTSGSGDVMGRLHWDRPSVTIRTEFVKPEKGRYLHPEEHRSITLQEGARLQGFDDDYLWCGSKTAIAKQIGNAVPIQLSAAIGRVIRDALA